VKPLTSDLQTLEERIGHHFADPLLLRTALTHRSFGTPHNERLEFIGDGVLNCVVADLLFRRFTELPEGDLSRLRANLVRQDTLHKIALMLDLGSALRLGDGEKKSGGNARPSMLADSFEALVGAVYLDQGFDVAHALISRQYEPMIEQIDLTRDMKDPKTRLQEVLQGRRLPLPEYAIVETQGEQHVQEFVVSCVIQRLSIRTEGRGSSRRLAEQRAASLALDALAHQGGGA
jgi:ribonuclease III